MTYPVLGRSLLCMIVLALTALVPLSANAQEGGIGGNCANGLDDESDGFVDQWDTECGVVAGGAASCTLPATPPVGLGITSLATSDVNGSDGNLARVQPIAADVDADGQVEIISPSVGSNIVIQDGTTLVTEQTITGAAIGYLGQSLAVAQLDPSNPELEIAWIQGAPTVSGTNLPTFLSIARWDGSAWVIYRSTVDLQSNHADDARDGAAVAFADFDQDGVPEIYVGASIHRFNVSGATPTVDLLVDARASAGGTASGRQARRYVATVAADITADPGLELAAGDHVYNINTVASPWSATIGSVLVNANTGDGLTAVADMDLDGDLDVIVSDDRNRVIYIWDPSGPTLLARWTFADRATQGYPSVGQVFDDGSTPNYPEVVAVGRPAARGGIAQTSTIEAWNLSDTMDPLWRKAVVDTSSSTTRPAFFDFNGDGIDEIVYRDQVTVDILYGGPAGALPPGVGADREFASIACTSLTRWEGAIIADINQDDHAEIVAACGSRIQSFGFVGTPWPDARPIWNQHFYNPAVVNDDGTIPAVQQDHWVEIPAGSGQYPINNWMKQVSPLDVDNIPPGTSPAPDAQVGNTTAGGPFALANIDCSAGNEGFDVTVNVSNATGTAPIPSGLPITFYLGDPAAGGTVLGVVNTTASIAPGANSDFTFSLTAVGAGVPLEIYWALNDLGTNPAMAPVVSTPECVTTNNVFGPAQVCGDCVDDATGAQDTGCTSSLPVCDGTTETCLICEDNEAPGTNDFGCNDALPACDDSGSAPVCRECVVNGDCDAGEQCNTDTNTCEVCLDDAAMGMDTGCMGATPICDDDSGGPTACVTCEDSTATGVDDGCDAANPACDEGMDPHSCVPCLDTTLLGQDEGCDTSEPVCDTSGATNTCVECLADADCPAGNVCDGNNECQSCLDTTMGGQDQGCSAALPVCQVQVSGNVCRLCEDNMTGAALDNGCDAAEPICTGSGSTLECVECLVDAHCAGASVCNTATNTCSGCIDDTMGMTDTGCSDGSPACNDTGAMSFCEECEDSEMGGATDNGCTSAEPLCDTSGAAPTCIACADTTMGGTDAGCDAVNPVCDTTDPINPVCINCEDSAGGNMQDNGCPLTTPLCDEADPANPVCIECDSDDDCATGACNLATNSCVTCVDDATGSIDSGCSDATPVCDVSDAANPVCIPCEDNMEPGQDFGCDSDRPVCDTANPSGATCVACDDDTVGMVDDGCGGATPVCDLTDPLDPSCVTCEDNLMGTMTDNGCDAANPLCNDDGAAPVCTECETDAECSAPTPVCNDAGMCSPGCNDDDDCAGTPATPVCDVPDEACVECVMDSNCPADSPVCDTDTNSCVVCQENADCAAPTPVCDVANDACVECVADMDCPSGVCDTVSNTCTGCLDNDDCPAAMPVCATDTNMCVICLVNSDCPMGAPICDSDNTCVECNSNDDCDTGMCDPDTNTCEGPECTSDLDCQLLDPDEPVCDEGTCVECIDDADCPFGSACNVIDQVCFPTCGLDGVCPADAPICIEEDNLCVECEDDDDCPMGLTCSDSNTCEPPCTTDEDCTDPASPACDTDDMVCVECTSDVNCPEGNVCDTDANECVECVADGDCEDGVCAPDNTCVECNEDDDCDDGFCASATNSCEENCTTNDDCFAELPVCDTDAEECVECLEDGDCSNGERCVDGENVCEPGCSTNDNCENPDFPVCEVDSGNCVECVEGADCPSGVCSEGNICAPPEGPECQSNADCEDLDASEPVCDTGTCVECIVDGDCADGQTCNGTNMCETACESDDDCSDDAPACDTDAGVCVECLEDEQCGDDEACDVASNSCAPACTDDDECGGERPFCNTDDGVCVGCVTDDQCDDSVCDEEQARCVECTATPDCADDEVCSDSNVCIGCSTDDDCGDLLCDTTSGTCYAGCSEDPDCQNPRLPVCDTDNSACVECLGDTDCTDMEVCAEGNFCEPAGEAMGCDSDADCDDDRRPVCLEDETCGCEETDDCSDDRICDPATNGCVDGCMEDEDCGDDDRPVCLETSLCGCTEDADCGDDQICNEDAVCEDAGGQTCEDNDDCPDGFICEDDVCVDDGTTGGGDGGLAGGSCSAVGNADAGTFFAVLGLGALFFRRRRD